MDKKEWIKQTNCSIAITNKNLVCLLCKQQYSYIYEIKDNGLYCSNCLFVRNRLKIFDEIFQTKSFLFIRGLKDINFENKTKKIPKTLNKSLRYFILKRDGFKCRACGKTSKKTSLQVDHIIPKSKGGKNTLMNLQTLCFDCNIGKGARW